MKERLITVQRTGEFTDSVDRFIRSTAWKILFSAGKPLVIEIVHNGNPIAFNHCDG